MVGVVADPESDGTSVTLDTLSASFTAVPDAEGRFDVRRVPAGMVRITLERGTRARQGRHPLVRRRLRRTPLGPPGGEGGGGRLGERGPRLRPDAQPSSLRPAAHRPTTSCTSRIHADRRAVVHGDQLARTVAVPIAGRLDTSPSASCAPISPRFRSPRPTAPSPPRPHQPLEIVHGGGPSARLSEEKRGASPRKVP